jgi:S-methylmethionine-dependent homocysteine/selenocysteine methylase
VSALSPALEAVLAERVVLLSGACGTELERRGAATPLPLWSAAALRDAPDLVREVHEDHVRAGARVVTANTFRTDRRTLGRAGLAGEARAWTKRAVALAREAVARARPPRPVAVAGSVAPLEDCYRPDLVPGDATLRAEHGVRVGDLVSAGVDLALVETMNTAREAVAALGACRAAGLPAAVSFVCGPGARLLSGEPVAEAVAAVLASGPAPLALLVNCCAPAVATEALAAVRAAARDVRRGTYANGPGSADPERGWRSVPAPGTDVVEFLSEARRALALGATFLGGCCGTTPEHVAALARLLAEEGRAAGAVSH